MFHKTADSTGPVCPRTGRPLTAPDHPKTSRIPVWLSFLTGGVALIWFLIRVIPKPSRATYPCQRVAFPIASAFVAYLFGLSGAALAFRRARRLLGETRYVMATLCVFAALACALLAGDTSVSHVCAYTPDPSNSPVGVAKGIHPGRVSWAWDPDATTGETTWYSGGPYYWDDAHTNQAVVDALMSKSVQWLAGETSDLAAWDALFRDFNRTHGRGDVGYTSGERIFIKTNHVDQRRHVWNYNRADITPAVELSILKQLVYQAGVPENMITIGDPSRFFADKSYVKCHDVFESVHYGESPFYVYTTNPVTDPPGGYDGRELLTSTTEAVIHYSGVDDYTSTTIPDGHIPAICHEGDPHEVTYIISLGIMKGHGNNGVTLSGKNWYGCFGEPPGGWGGSNPGAQHHLLADLTPNPNHYRLMVDLMGHKELGGKTMLYILDGLWGFQRHGSSGVVPPVKWSYAPFNNDYPSSIFMSQDTVAIDSVGLDFLWTEFANTLGGRSSGEWGALNDYMREAAKAYGADSGTVYDPEADATPCPSLGVHEHWNNSTDKQYTRNLGTGSGIELVNYDLVPPTPTPTPLSGPTGAMDWTLFQ